MLPPLFTGPVTGLTSSVTLEITGAVGATVSTTMVIPAEGGLVWPAASVAVVVRVWLPLASALGGVKLQLPLASTLVVPILVPLSKTVMVVPASPIPLRVGRASSVRCPLSSGPVSLPTSSLTIKMSGASGVTRSGAVAWASLLTLPEESVAVAVICSPLLSGVPSSIVNLPSLPVLPVPTRFPFASFRVMVLFGSAVPVTILPSAENCRLVGASGGVVSGSDGFPGLPGLPLPLSSSPPPPPPPPPPPAASAIPPATATPPSTHGQIAAPPVSPEEAISASIEEIAS
ncbi:hypothetical protein D3C72_1001160 [compost metagenome]